MKTIAVIGAGTMGLGIAQLAAGHGGAVRLIDVSSEALRRGLDEIRKHFDRAVAKGRMTGAERHAAAARIQLREEIGNLEDAELVIEAVVEDLSIKQNVFRELETATSQSTVLATNTSSLSVTKIAEAVENPGRVIGMHFFNPVPIMPLVEVVAGANSHPLAVDAGFAAATAWGKKAIRVKDSPGFVVNRIARGYYLEALRLLGEGVAGVDEIDRLMRVHGGFKMGPFELMDLVGLDVNLAVSTSVWEEMERDARFTPHEIQRKLVERGQLGRKSGRGFYLYEGDAPPVPAVQVDRRSFHLSPLLSGAVEAFARRATANKLGATEQYVFARVLAAILNEAALALDQGIASREDIDIAMRMGTNYPKGPIAWSDEIGLRTLRGLLKALNESTGDNRYAAAKSIADTT